jgi:hypothetical protein
VFFIGRDDEDPVQHVPVEDGDMTFVAIPGHVCRRLFRHKEKRVCWLDDDSADLPGGLRKEVAHLMSTTKTKLQDEAICKPYVADIALLRAPQPEREASAS